MKYMSDIVDAGGRLTQAYDSFLNVRANASDHHRSPSPHRADIHELSSQGFCAAVPETYLEILNKNTTDIDYIGMCCRHCSIQRPFLIASHPRA
jgi:hypothetical protein